MTKLAATLNAWADAAARGDLDISAVREEADRLLWRAKQIRSVVAKAIADDTQP